jgi:hypothetical protein
MPLEAPTDVRDALDYLLEGPGGRYPFVQDEPLPWSALFTWIACRKIGAVVNPVEAAEVSRSWIDEWQLNKVIIEAFQGMGMDQGAADRGVGLIKLLISHGGGLISPDQPTETSEKRPLQLLQAWLRDADLQRYLGFNRYQGVLWFNKESFEEWIWWAFSLAVIDLTSTTAGPLSDEMMEKIVSGYHLVRRLQQAANASEYQVDKLLEAIQGV